MKVRSTGKRGNMRISGDIRGMPTMLEPIPMPKTAPALADGGKSDEKLRKKDKEEVAAVNIRATQPMDLPPMLEPIPMPRLREDGEEN